MENDHQSEKKLLIVKQILLVCTRMEKSVEKIDVDVNGVKD